MKKTLILIITLAAASACSEKGSRYDAEGSFESDEITVSAEATGRILSLDIREGQTVTAGEEVGCIDSLQLYLTKLQLQKNVKSVVSNRPNITKQNAALKEQLSKLQAERTRVQNMLKDGAATHKQMDDIESQITVVKAQLEAQNTTLRGSASSIDAQSSSIDMQIAMVDDQLSKCHVTSPVSGTVLSTYAHMGEFTAAGKPLFKVADLDHVFLRAYVTSAQLSEIRLGQGVKVYADFGGESVHEYDGVIEWISSKSEFTPKSIQTADERQNLVYAVKVAVENDGFIKLGMYGGIRY